VRKKKRAANEPVGTTHIRKRQPDEGQPGGMWPYAVVRVSLGNGAWLTISEDGSYDVRGAPEGWLYDQWELVS